MFGKNHNNPYLPSPYLGLAADDILFDDDMLSAHYLSGDANHLSDPTAFFGHHDVGGLNADPSGLPPRAATAAAAAKKDRHSKINTAQGPRDRRVRLSIGVARRFFDLQEILGFDKPSKTLDWLLTKSKTAILDLVQSSKENTSSSPSEVDSPEASETGKRKITNSNKQKDLAKESRAKARARARERTREKMSIKKLNQGDSSNPSAPIQYMNNQLEYCKISGGCNAGIREAMLHCQCHPTYNSPNHEDLIQEESIVIKRKVKHPSSSILGFQQNLIISSSSNYAVPSPADNWDITTSFASQSNICAILDQHRFIN